MELLVAIIREANQLHKSITALSFAYIIVCQGSHNDVMYAKAWTGINIDWPPMSSTYRV